MEENRSEIFIENILNFLVNLREDPGTYRISRSTKASLLSACFASFILYGLSGAIRRFGFDLKDITKFLIGKRLRDGTFWDDNYPISGTDTHDAEYLIMQFTTLCLSSLNASGFSDHIEVSYIHKFYFPDKLKNWLASLNWRNAWMQGNRVMFLGILLLHNWEKGGSTKAKAAFNILLDYLDKMQDTSTGFWGIQNGASLHNAMAGAFHLFLLYDYVSRPFHFSDRIINNVLKLQNKNDHLFSPYGGGGACDDLDAIYSLISCSHKINHRKSEIDESLTNAYSSLIKIQNKDGGFPYTKRYRYDIDLIKYLISAIVKKMSEKQRYARIKNLPVIIKKKCLPFQFSGNPECIIPPHESDLFSSWFRLCSLALIESYFDNNKWKNGLGWWRFLPSAGLGWHRI